MVQVTAVDSMLCPQSDQAILLFVKSSRSWLVRSEFQSLTKNKTEIFFRTKKNSWLHKAYRSFWRVPKHTEKAKDVVVFKSGPGKKAPKKHLTYKKSFRLTKWLHRFIAHLLLLSTTFGIITHRAHSGKWKRRGREINSAKLKKTLMCFWIENRYLFYLTTKDTECSRSRVINGKEKPPPILRLMMGWWHAPVVGRWFHGPYNLLYSRSSCTEGIANDDDDDGEFRDMQRFNLPFESVHKSRTDSSFLTWRKRREEKKRPTLNVDDEIMVISQRLGKTQPNYSLLRNVVSFLFLYSNHLAY